LIRVPGDVFYLAFLVIVGPEVVFVNDIHDLPVGQRARIVAADTGRCAAFEETSRLVAGWVGQLEGSPVEPETKIDLLRWHGIAPV
jgi:hypothetical protein